MLWQGLLGDGSAGLPRASNVLTQERKTMTTIKSADDLFTNELRQIYSAEKQLSRALPRLMKAVNTDSVREKFEERSPVCQ